MLRLFVGGPSLFPVRSADYTVGHNNFMLRIFLIVVVTFFVTLAAHGFLGSALSRGATAHDATFVFLIVSGGLLLLALGLAGLSFWRLAGRRWMPGSVAAGLVAGAVVGLFAAPLYI